MLSTKPRYMLTRDGRFVRFFRFEDLEGKAEPAAWGPCYPKTASAAVEKWRAIARGREPSSPARRRFMASPSASGIRALNAPTGRRARLAVVQPRFNAARAPRQASAQPSPRRRPPIGRAWALGPFQKRARRDNRAGLCARHARKGLAPRRPNRARARAHEPAAGFQAGQGRQAQGRQGPRARGRLTCPAFVSPSPSPSPSTWLRAAGFEKPAAGPGPPKKGPGLFCCALDNFGHGGHFNARKPNDRTR